MKLALVHDYLREYGGAERVVEAMHSIWPEAPLYTAFVDWDGLGKHASRFRSWDIRESWLSKRPLIKRYISPLRFLAPKVWESFDLSDYDVILTSSGWFIPRGVKVKNPTVQVCYIHHPPRNLYGYATGSDLQKYAAVRAYATFINFFIRQYDFKTAQSVHTFIANSKETARRVEKFYRRDSTVIYPPIDIPRTKPIPTGKREGYYLAVGRLTYAKRFDVIIEACNRLHAPLRIVGVGKEEQTLRGVSGPTIRFEGSVDDKALSSLYANARALIFCARDEDFGMVPVEAMGYGTPVIALSEGGVRETVLDGKTGILFARPEPEAVVAAITRFESVKNDWTSACSKHAQTFSSERFGRELMSAVSRAYNHA